MCYFKYSKIITSYSSQKVQNRDKTAYIILAVAAEYSSKEQKIIQLRHGTSKTIVLNCALSEVY